MLKQYRADLHIHTCLSPCADLEMSPRAIIQKAKEKGLDIIGITDHNSSDHVLVTKELGREVGIFVVGGMEVTTQEEVHLLVLFEEVEQTLTFQGYIYSHLPDKENDPEIFGFQPIVNRNDEILEFNRRLLMGATDVSLNQLINKACELDGIIIASHVDRDAFSLTSQLGMIPPDIHLDAIEISHHFNKEKIRTMLPTTGSFPLILASDAHFLEDIGKSITVFVMREPKVEEFKMAFKHEKGRKILS